MQKAETYRPATIEFDVAHDGTKMPLSFGAFETHEEASKFLGGKLMTTNQAMTVSRHMDHVEKSSSVKSTKTPSKTSFR